VTTPAAIKARESSESHRQPNQSHDVLSTQPSELRAAMNTQNVLLTRMQPHVSALKKALLACADQAKSPALMLGYINDR